MNAFVVTGDGQVRVVAEVGCIELRPGPAALLRNESGEVVASVGLSEGVWLAVSGVASDEGPPWVPAAAGRSPRGGRVQWS